MTTGTAALTRSNCSTALFRPGSPSPTITYAEYYEGVVLSPRVAEHLESLESFLSGLALLPVDRAVARVFGEQRARLRARGRLIDNFDLDRDGDGWGCE